MANPADFAGGTAQSGTLSFAAGQAAQNIALNIQGNAAVEADEGCRVLLSHLAGGAAISTGSAIASIINDDPSGPSADLAARTTHIAMADFSGDGSANLPRESPISPGTADWTLLRVDGPTVWTTANYDGRSTL